jgi:uncharacterized protein
MPWDVWLIFLVLGVFVPWRGRVRLRELLAKSSVNTRERLSLYASTIAFQWSAAVIAAWRAWAHRFSREQLGLIVNNRREIAVIAVAGAALIATLQWFNLRRMGRLTAKLGDLRALAERILPQSPKERLLFSSLAVTAGVCEEFLYRGFAMASLTRAGLPIWSVVLVSSILFGLAHLYQGRGGLVGTIILGVLFAVARTAYNSLAPVVAWHIAVDLIAGVAGRKYLVQRDLAAPKPMQMQL